MVYVAGILMKKIIDKQKHTEKKKAEGVKQYCYCGIV